MAEQGVLRHWKRFYATFHKIDDAIEAAAPDFPLKKFRSRRGRTALEMLCDAKNDDEAGKLCRVLDLAMVESLHTLQSVPMTLGILERTVLYPAIIDLGTHESERVRALSRDVLMSWNAYFDSRDPLAAVEEARARYRRRLEGDPGASAKKTAPVVAAAAAKAIPQPVPKKPVPVVAAAAGKAISQPVPNKTAPVVAAAAREAIPEPAPKKTVPNSDHNSSTHVDAKMEATKRKLREGYQEVEHVKRQRMIQVIEAPEMTKQRLLKHRNPIMRLRAQVKCSSSAAERRSLMSSLVKF